MVNAVAPDWNLKKLFSYLFHEWAVNAVAPDWNLKENKGIVARLSRPKSINF